MDDGYRVLVERLWPRGVSKERAHVDLWMKDAGASRELRVWFGHDPDKWEDFRTRYFEEIRGRPEVIRELDKISLPGKKPSRSCLQPMMSCITMPWR